MEEQAFDLAISAGAFHWIPPELGYPKVGRALKRGGSVALFWNMPVEPETEWSRAVAELYRREFPGIENPDAQYDFSWLVDIIKNNFSSGGLFGDVTIRKYRLTERIDGPKFIKLLRTHSSHRHLNETTRRKLNEKMLALFEQFGDSVEKPRLIVCFQAKVKRTY